MAIGCRFQRGRSWLASLTLLALLAVLGAAGWWYFAPQTLPSAVRERLPAAAAHNPVLYKWKDDQGRWNITDRPPDGRAFEEVQVDPDVNVLPAGVPPELDRD
jgi:hypothetical protein